MNSEQNQLKTIVNECFKKLKTEFYQQHKFEKIEADNPPLLLTMRDTVEALPPKISCIKVSRKKDKKEDVGFLLKYDYTELNSSSIQYCGEVKCSIDNLTKIASSKFNLKNKDISMCTDDIPKNFSQMMTWEPTDTWCLHFIPKDILKNPELLFSEWKKMTMMLREVPILTEKFQRDNFENFNEIYKLNSEPVLSLEEITKSETNSLLNLDLNGPVETIQK